MKTSSTFTPIFHIVYKSAKYLTSGYFPISHFIELKQNMTYYDGNEVGTCRKEDGECYVVVDGYYRQGTDSIVLVISWLL